MDHHNYKFWLRHWRQAPATTTSWQIRLEASCCQACHLHRTQLNPSPLGMLLPSRIIESDDNNVDLKGYDNKVQTQSETNFTSLNPQLPR
jgi:hypothetical protein